MEKKDKYKGNIQIVCIKKQRKKQEMSRQVDGVDRLTDRNVRRGREKDIATDIEEGKHEYKLSSLDISSLTYHLYISRGLGSPSPQTSHLHVPHYT